MNDNPNNIRATNANGLRHGYYELYWYNSDTIMFNGTFDNDNRVGYHVWYKITGKPKRKTYYII